MEKTFETVYFQPPGIKPQYCEFGRNKLKKKSK